MTKPRTRKSALQTEMEDKREEGLFVTLGRPMLQSREFAELTPYEVKALLDLVAQYQFNNNGDLDATWNRMKARGWVSKETLYKAISGLIKKGFVLMTRQGGRTHKPTLYAVTFFKVDYCKGKLEIEAPADHRKAWKRYAPTAAPLKPTKWPMSREVRDALREKDPELLKQLSRQTGQWTAN